LRLVGFVDPQRREIVVGEKGRGGANPGGAYHRPHAGGRMVRKQRRAGRHLSAPQVWTRPMPATPAGAVATGAAATGATATGAAALGAFAIGAFAIGAVAIGRLVIRRATIKRIQVGELEDDQLTVRRLRVLEHDQPADDR
jgi:hypothetical protein